MPATIKDCLQVRLANCHSERPVEALSREGEESLSPATIRQFRIVRPEAGTTRKRVVAKSATTGAGILSPVVRELFPNDKYRLVWHFERGEEIGE
jgi:hypothetical protein